MSGPGIFIDEDENRDAVPRAFAVEPPKPATGFIDNWRASREAVKATGRTDSRDVSLRDAYDPIVDSLNEGFVKADWSKGILISPDADRMFRNPYRGRTPNPALDASGGMPVEEQRIWAEIVKRRRADPKAFPHLPATRDQFVARLNAEAGASLEREADVSERATLGGKIGGFLGAMTGGFTDPPNMASMMIGLGPSRSILQTAIREGAINAATELVSTPALADRRKEVGKPMTTEEAALNIVIAGALGATVGGTAEGTRRWVGSLRRGKKIEDLTTDELLELTADMKLDNPEVRQARTVLETHREVEASNPLANTPEAHAEHVDRLQGAIDSALDDRAERPQRAPKSAGERLAAFSDATGEGQRLQIERLTHDIRAAQEAAERPVAVARAREVAEPLELTPAATGGALPSDIVQFFKSKGYSDHLARGITAGIVAESAGNHRAINPTSGAMGLGQHLGPRKRELLNRYGPNPSRRQQLEFLHWELQGGDHGGAAVLGARNEVEALDRYINKFMRPAKGAETTGDLRRGQAALGRAGQSVPTPKPIMVSISEEVVDGETRPVMRPVNDVLADLDGDDAFIRAVEACL